MDGKKGAIRVNQRKAEKLLSASGADNPRYTYVTGNGKDSNFLKSVDSTRRENSNKLKMMGAVTDPKIDV